MKRRFEFRLAVFLIVLMIPLFVSLSSRAADEGAVSKYQQFLNKARSLIPGSGQSEEKGKSEEKEVKKEETAGVKEEAPEYEELLKVARNLASQGELGRARAAIERAGELAPKNSAVMKQMIGIYLASDEKKAGKLLEEVIAGDDFPGLKTWATRQYYKLAQKRGDVNAAREALENLRGDQLNNVGLERAIAEGYVKNGDWNQVVNIYENLVKENPGNHTLFVRLVDAYMMQRNYEAVVKKLEPIVAANPDDRANSDILARAYVGAGRIDEALVIYKHKVAKKPDSPGLRGRYAQALMEFEMWEASRREWQRAYELDPKNLLFKLRVGEIYLREGKLREAEKEFSELYALASADNPRFKEVARSYLESIKEQLKN